MTHNIFIDGAVGTTGLEIAERLAQIAEYNLITLSDVHRKDIEARRDAINSSDFTILCLPDEAARDAVSLSANDNVRIIDASSAHRTSPNWTYGFAEFRDGQREQIAEARFVSNPGCYPTGFLGLIAPLIAKGLLPADWPYTVNAVSGYSGGGKALIERFVAEPDIGFRSYGLTLDHKHMAEMKAHAGLSHDVIFSPAVVRAYRGMIVEVPLNLAAMQTPARASDLLTALQDHYQGSSIVVVAQAENMQEILLNEGSNGTDRMELLIFNNENGEQARLIARLDNLGKGAGGGAIQNLNIMAGLPETLGLRLN